ncbi:MAG TPA: hypothetical protein VG370_08195 [Chloroflexota bacterium]|nr:hypothetical protein [Chloroflexota bacterium]
MPPVRSVRPSSRAGTAGHRPTAAPRRPAAAAGAPHRRRRQDQPRQRLLALGMLGLFLLSFAAILFVLYRLILAEGGAPSARSASPTPIPIPPNAARFGSLAEFERAQRGRPGSAFVIVITEPELNGRIAAAIQKQPNLPFRNVTAKIRDDRVDFEGLARAAGLEISAAVGLRPRAVNTRLGYELLSVDLGPVPVPGVARRAISDSIDRELERARLTDGFALDAVQAREGAVTLVGRFR